MIATTIEITPAIEIIILIAGIISIVVTMLHFDWLRVYSALLTRQ